MKIPLIGTEITLSDDTDITGIGLTIFTAGCPHMCKGCHNEQSWDVKNGVLTELQEIKSKIKKSITLIKYICFCGGEPLLYKEAVVELSKFSKQYGLKVILYTGYRFEEIEDDILLNIDTIIDGRYEIELDTGKFPASENQNIYVNGNKLSRQEIDTLQINKKFGG